MDCIQLNQSRHVERERCVELGRVRLTTKPEKQYTLLTPSIGRSRRPPVVHPGLSPQP